MVDKKVIEAVETLLNAFLPVTQIQKEIVIKPEENKVPRMRTIDETYHYIKEHDMKNGEKVTYEKQFYSINHKKKQIYGFPYQMGAWCNSMMKRYTLNYATKKVKGATQYIGVAADEENRIARWTRDGFSLPLVKIGWSEADCLKWCKENNLLSPIYTTATRGGCWFCHNQTFAGVQEATEEKAKEIVKNFLEMKV